MTEFAAGVFVILASAVVLVVVVAGLVGPGHADIAQKCRAHHGVQQIAHSLVWKDETMVVCRDGSVWAP